MGAPAIADGLAHGSQRAFEGGVADEPLRPDLLAQLLLQDRAVPMLQQVEQHLEHFGPQPHGLAGALQPMLLGIEDTVVELVHHHRLPWGSLAPMTPAAPGAAGGPHIQTGLRSVR